MNPGQPNPTPAEIIRQKRREHEMTLDELSHVLDTSRQRVSQWENGDPIPAERVTAWLNDSALPDWVRQMAREIEIADLKQVHSALGTRIDKLGQSAA